MHASRRLLDSRSSVERAPLFGLQLHVRDSYGAIVCRPGPLVAVTFALVLGGCAVQQVRTIDMPAGSGPIICPAARILPFRLAIDLTASDPVWGIWESDQSRFEIAWPPGFSLRSGPDPVLVDVFGTVIGPTGTLIDDAGGSGGNPVTICSLGDVIYPLD